MTLTKWLNFSHISSVFQSIPPAVRTGLFRALCLFAPFLLFLTFFTPDVLNPTRIGWTLEADWGQHVLGWNAFRHMPWSSFNHEDLLGAPVGNSIIYTDSNPLFAFIFKGLQGFLPSDFQYIGPWFLFCICLHVVFAYKLVRPHAPNRWAALGGTLALSALPALYYRMRHDTLMAHWLILWALHLFINVEDRELPAIAPEAARHQKLWAILRAVPDPKTCGYFALFAINSLIHPYILFMVAAIWGGDVLRVFWPAARAMDRKALLLITLRAVVVLAAAAVMLGISGVYAQGQSPGAGGWSYYSAGLDSFFNPVRAEFSAILKAWPQSAGQAFEGYQYLGFGLLMLIAAAVVLYVMTPEAKASRPFFAKIKPLTLPFIALALIAFTNHVQIYGYTVIKFDLPPQLRGVLAVLRASGRFLWPLAYCGVLAALVVLFKSRARTIAIILPAILVIQAYDLAGFASAMRAATALSASPQTYYLTPSPEWDRLVAVSKGIDFYPTNVHFNDKLFYELTWRATSDAKPVNTMYAARENLIQIANEQADQDAFKRGVVRNDRLFVFLKQCDAPRTLQPRLRMLDGVWIIPPDAAKDIPLQKPVWSPIDSKMRFGWLDQGTCMLDENWSQPDNDGVWSEGPKADVLIPIRHVQFDSDAPGPLDLKLRVRAKKPVLVKVLVNGVKVSEITLTWKKSEHVIRLPASVMRYENLKVRFIIERPDGTPVEADPEEPHGRTRGLARDQEPAIKLMNMNLIAREKPRPAVPAFAG